MQIKKVLELKKNLEIQTPNSVFFPLFSFWNILGVIVVTTLPKTEILQFGSLSHYISQELWDKG